MYRLSIITVCLNSEKTIEETIKSIVSQKRADIEYIIIDGGSTDQTLSIIEKYHDRIDKVISEKDNGISDAFNKGIGVAEGEYIGIINSDDLLLSGAVNTVLSEMRSDTDIYFGQGIRYFSDAKCKKYAVNPDYHSLHTSMQICHPATFVRKVAYERFGTFSLEYKCAMDRELLLRMLNGGAKFQYTDKYLVVYRMGGMSDEQYLKKVLPEMYKINIDDGMLKWRAIIEYFKGIAMYYLLKFRNKMVRDNKLKSYDEIIKEVV